MEKLLLDIIRAVREGPAPDARQLERIIHRHSNRLPGEQRFSKKQLAPYYLRVREGDPRRWQSWNVDPETERRLLTAIQMKPRRTASGVATITVITKPWPCSGNCLFCPNDVRMPKSYLHAEPACQRAERNWFDPYLQVAARMRALIQMGHPTDKVELIVLGGTWSDYPAAYRVWFIHELFRALNDDAGTTEDAWAGGMAQYPASPKGPACADDPARRRARYRAASMPADEEALAREVEDVQREVDAGTLPFNASMRRLYGAGTAWEGIAAWQQAGMEDLQAQQQRNEHAAHRCVGLVVETRPDAIDAGSLHLLRQLGCTKVQVGVQSLDQGILDANHRNMEVATIARAFCLLRLFGFKIHAHFMVNLPGATPEGDKRDYRIFATDERYQPDEVKLYPCALVRGAPMAELHRQGGWAPYPEGTLVDILAADVLATPAHTRISRMIRDFSAGDIVTGNKKTNLRQMVEAQLDAREQPVREIRYREVGTEGADLSALRMEDAPYRTAATDEHFLQWVTPQGKIAGFLRLSLPHPDAVRNWEGLPIGLGEAMIREVHVYGKAARIHGTGEGPQHAGLGKGLVARAERIAREAGYTRLNVISAVGTRAYYRKLGFQDAGLYQSKPLR